MTKFPIQTLPTESLVSTFANATVETQERLRVHSMQTIQKMNDPKHAVEINLPSGKVKRTLMELGFSPTILYLQRAQFEAKLAFSYVEETTRSRAKSKSKIGLKIGRARSSRAQSHNAEYSCRYQVRSEGASRLQMQVKAVPQPPAFEELLANRFSQRQKERK